VAEDARNRFSRLAALSGIAYVFLVFFGSAAIGGTSGAGRHSLDVADSDISDYIREADVTRVWVGEYVAVVGYALFVLFAAYVWSVVRGSAERDWRDSGVVGPALIYVALAMIATACLAPVLNRTGNAEDAARFLDFRSVLFAMAFLFFAMWLVGVGVRSLQSRTLPIWIGWSALVIGVLQFVGTAFASLDPGFTGVPTFAGFLWVAIVSVLLARRGQRS
jgi:Domain of unknown function (DUF4386)